MSGDITLPLLPPAEWLGYDPERGDLHGHSFDVMREFARAAVLLDRQQRTPPAAPQGEADAYGYASRLAVAIWEKHYKDAAPQWKPLDDLIGVLTQIDNMSNGLSLASPPAPSAEPVAIVQHRKRLCSDWYDGHADHDDGRGPYEERTLYTTPPDHLAVMRQALEALEERYIGALRDNALDALRAALEGKR
jgi:hypothetical protein